MKARSLEAGHVRRVLFATDFSEASAAAARTAQVFARRFSAELHVLHAVCVSDVDEPLEQLDRLAAELGEGRPVIAAISAKPISPYWRSRNTSRCSSGRAAMASSRFRRKAEQPAMGHAKDHKPREKNIKRSDFFHRGFNSWRKMSSCT